MALKGAEKRTSTCFTSVAAIAQHSLITEPQDSEQTHRRFERKFRGFLCSDVNETISYQLQMTRVCYLVTHDIEETYIGIVSLLVEYSCV